jgi:hypothetical protein
MNLLNTNFKKLKFEFLYNIKMDVLIAYEPRKIVHVPYHFDEPVYLFKLRVTNKLILCYPMLSTKNTALFINGIKITNEDKHIKYYKILVCIYIYFTYKKNIKINININVIKFTGKKHNFIVNTSITVHELKTMIQGKEGIPLDQQRLVYAGIQIENDHTLTDYNIKKEVTIHLILRLRGGGIGPTKFVDVSNTSGIQKVQLSMSAPRGRIVHKGINIEIKCLFTSDYRVISPQGIGLFDLIYDANRVKCPLCQQSEIKLETVGFINCEYRIHGIKIDKSPYSSEWKIVKEEDQYQVFDPNKSGKTE